MAQKPTPEFRAEAVRVKQQPKRIMAAISLKAGGFVHESHNANSGKRADKYLCFFRNVLLLLAQGVVRPGGEDRFANIR